jgi:protein-S-isoprenylcysteine O-methyltransferase Ste14
MAFAYDVYNKNVPAFVFAILAAGWLAWMIPFFVLERGPRAQTVDRQARWGIVLEAIGFFLVWLRPLWIAAPGPWRVAGAVTALGGGALFSWTGALALGRQWRFDAALNADHRLVQSGAYRLVRHPIYTSMLCMLVGSGLLLARLAVLAAAVVLFLAGTEIRVRTEERLLASRFGPEFDAYRRRVHAYVPFLKRWR